MTSRREFLTAQPLREALQQAAQADGECLPLAANTVRLGKTAMASDFEVILNAGAAGLLSAASEAVDLIDQLEDQMSVYRPHSALSRLNARAATEPVVVERQLFELLRTSVAYARETEGAFDPTAGPLVALWRHCRRERRLPTDDELHATRARVGFGDVEFNDDAGAIQFRRPGIELNLNAIGKGYALDRAGEVLAKADGRYHRQEAVGQVSTSNSGSTQEGAATPNSTRPAGDWLMHGGHSSILARGNLRGADGWPIALRHPLFPNRQWAVIWLKDGAMSTSGSAVQFFRVGDRRYGHLLDPRTGWPAEGLLSVTVLAPTAAQAEVFSTAFFVLGVEKARRYCHNHPEISALIVPVTKRGQRLDPIVCGISETDLNWAADESSRSDSTSSHSTSAPTSPPAA
ncbi:MAG: FAD:protein FMN transferase [Planctomycetaceae bacterium]|nr:FAD:protein FMN transferase [Planctomycetaceae bacterium]